ncbi:DnaJ domain-containing protein [Patescibacteria group bacterium]|nr:DnaJ domain-containing protein [Patescibacteria group bacterium]
MNNNYYQILDVREDASEIEIKKAYRRLARQFHPDITQTSEAESAFKEINRAYDILSDALKRADYDARLHPAETQAQETPEPVAEEASSSAASRISATAAIFLIGAGILEFFLRWLFPESPASGPLLYIFGLVLGIFSGLIWGIDNNLDLNAILGPTIMGRFYTLLRSLIFTLTLTYFLALVGAYLDTFFYDKIFFLTPTLGLAGAIIGATLGSTGETPERLSSSEGRFELLSIFLRGLEVGIITAVIGGVLGLIFLRLGYSLGILFWGIYFGFIFGMIAGSINPPNLTAYASYISASLKNAVIFLLIIGALILGLIVGVSFADTFKTIFAIIWESLMKIFNV